MKLGFSSEGDLKKVRDECLELPSTTINRDIQELSLKYVEDAEILVNGFYFIELGTGVDKTPWLCYLGRKVDLKLYSQ